MAWDASKPSDSEKIRNLGIVIRANWDAIEESEDTFAPWAIKLTNRTDVGAASNNPATLASATQLFCKDDSGAVAELFLRDAAGTVKQLTKGGKWGSIAMDYLFESFSHDNGTTSYNEDNFATAWAHYATGGGTTPVAPTAGGTGMGNAVRTAEGRWTVSFSTAVDSATGYVVLVQGYSTNRRVYQIDNQTTTGFDVRCDQSWNNVSGSVPKDSDFAVLVFGGR